ncbi:MAG: kynureninase, partial [Alphaproteobacteria bacterium]|nr:kynureninase [Alphaproteobacteria bacterium]
MTWEALDRDDPLAWLRGEFHLSPGVIYLDGNSLGLLSKPAERALLEALETWKRRGIDGWLGGGHPWFHFAEELGARIAPLLGAEADEVLIAGSTSINLHQMLATLFRPEPGRDKILIEEDAFPTDAHVAKSHLKLRGLDPGRNLVVVPSAGGTAIDEAAIIAAMRDDVAFAILPTALYRSGQLLDVARLAALAREKGVTLCLDAC